MDTFCKLNGWFCFTQNPPHTNRRTSHSCEHLLETEILLYCQSFCWLYFFFSTECSNSVRSSTACQNPRCIAYVLGSVLNKIVWSAYRDALVRGIYTVIAKLVCARVHHLCNQNANSFKLLTHSSPFDRQVKVFRDQARLNFLTPLTYSNESW